MSWIWTALMPHPPIIVPEVGRGREREAAPTLRGVEDLKQRLAGLAKPDVLLVLSPHQPYADGALFLNSAPRLRGSLAPFGAPSVSVDLAAPPDALDALAAHLGKHGIPTAVAPMDDLTRDHGAIVPLHLLAPCFAEGLPPVIVACPIGLDPEGALALGKALAAFKTEARWALLASGDLSHRLKPGGPGGFNPAGAVFDQAVVRALQTGDAALLTGLPRATLTGAGECGLRSVLTLLGLCGGPVEVFSYEGPFGVGYCNALWLPGEAAATEKGGSGRAGRAMSDRTTEVSTDTGPVAESPPGWGEGRRLVLHKGCSEEPPMDSGNERAYPRLARWTVTRHLVGAEAAAKAGGPPPDPEAPLWNRKKGCFVSIKTKEGALRGCIGTILPTRSRLDQEIMANAVAAATQDPRFPPMSAAELDNAVFSVDVLSTPEPVRDLKDLDPAVWGVIVTKGGRRGLLLPDLAGVDSVEKQLTIAAQKAGISDIAGAQIERFSVSRYGE